ncbi:zinc-ribbon domain-containing protein [Geomonas sp. RF6]|uniref:response regulator n=1 Tax=Geomonas sp. RF6 TaxID=2897342 RepID=UPI001E42B58E|nr:response regulator [Geomonas sp. RF6]UFS68976.1 zinc-ribbon domain-containing protein [Geomonas sp. RF6]
MLITCPNCKKTSSLAPKGDALAVKVRCANCRAIFRVVRKGTPPPAPAAPVAEGAPVAPAAPVAPVAPAASPLTSAPPPIASPPFQGEGQGGDGVEAAPASVQGAAPGTIRIVVANESRPFCEAIQKLLAAEPFEVHVSNDGAEALALVQKLVPQVLLLDVALPGMLGFEVCDRVRQDPALSGVKIVLVASIYDKTRYKRSPNSLYGADDYIEKHHIPDSLVPMIYRLSGTGPTEMTSPSIQELAVQDRARLELRQFEVRETSLPPRVEVPEAEKKARRLARIIVSDIALYNQAKVEQGVREGSFYTLLADDIREGERLYEQRVPEGVRARTSYLEEAFETLIKQKKGELQL